MADKKVNLKKNPLPEELKPVTADIPGVTGTLPFGMNTVISNNPNAIPSEETINRAKAAKAAMDAVAAKPIPAHKMDIPKPVNIDSLPPAKQAEVLEAIKQAGSVVTSVPNTKTVKTGIFADKLKEEEKPTIKVHQPEPEVEKKDAPEQASTMPLPDPAGLCKHCGWPIGQCDNTNPTMEDKRIFVASILGQKRFYKTYDLLGGQLKVVFRSLTTQEVDLIVKQLVEDWNNNKISGPAQSVAEAIKYQLALCLDSVEQSVGVLRVPEFEDYEYDPKDKGTPLPEIVEYVNNNFLALEHTRRVITKAYGHFIDTQSKLEAMAETPDFWKATEA